MSADVKKPRSLPWPLVAGAVLVVAVMFSLGGPSIALGATPTSTQSTSAAADQYAKSTGAVAGVSSGGNSTPPPATSATGGTLPFTGVSLIWAAAAAVALLGLGLGLRRYERKNS